MSRCFAKVIKDQNTTLDAETTVSCQYSRLRGFQFRRPSVQKSPTDAGPEPRAEARAEGRSTWNTKPNNNHVLLRLNGHNSTLSASSTRSLLALLPKLAS